MWKPVLSAANQVRIFFMPPNGRTAMLAVRLAAPGTAPMLQAQQLLRGLLDERLHGVLVAQPIAAGDGVVGVLVEAVVGAMTPAAPPSAETVWLRIG